MKLSRRELAALAATQLLAQPPAPVQAADDLSKAAHDANQRNSEALAKFEVPIATEPAFKFQP